MGEGRDNGRTQTLNGRFSRRDALKGGAAVASSPVLAALVRLMATLSTGGEPHGCIPANSHTSAARDSGGRLRTRYDIPMPDLSNANSAL